MKKQVVSMALALVMSLSGAGAVTGYATEGSSVVTDSAITADKKGNTHKTLLSSSVISVSYKTSYTYAGLPIKPYITVRHKGTRLEEGVDYKITGYRNNNAVGKGQISLRGKGKYKGTRTCYFTINQGTVTRVQWSAQHTEYTGESQSLALNMDNLKLKVNGNWVSATGSDITVTKPVKAKNAGERMSVTITPKNNYKGKSVCAYVSITRATLTCSNCDVKVKLSSNKKSIKSIDAHWRSRYSSNPSKLRKLTQGKDCEVASYTCDKKGKIKSVTIQGIGNFTGRVKVNVG